MVANYSMALLFLTFFVISTTLFLYSRNATSYMLYNTARYSRIYQVTSSDKNLVTREPVTATAVSKSPNDVICKSARKRKGVIIFATTRSGSSFLGEFFNQHPDVYYLFEPLHGIAATSEAPSLRETVMTDLLRCDYSQIPRIYNNSVADGWVQCESNICFAGRSNFLWRHTQLCVKKAPFCGVKKFDTKVLEKVCEQSLFTAIKIVRMPHLSELEPILTDPTLDIRVIQLVRDPRAVVPSRVRMVKTTADKMGPFAKFLCNFYSNNSYYATNCIMVKNDAGNQTASNVSCDPTVQDLWKGRFMRISHEYISERPLEAVKVVYDFVGLNYDSTVAQWMSNHTRIKERVSIKRQKRSLPKNFYSTSRDSKAVLNAWRLKLNFSDVSAIQNECMAAMSDFGYLPFTNLSDLKKTSEPSYNLEKGVLLPQKIVSPNL